MTYRCSAKRVFLKILQNSQESTCARVSFLMKLQAEAFNFIKKVTLAQEFSCEFFEITGKATFLIEHLRWLLVKPILETLYSLLQKKSSFLWISSISTWHVYRVYRSSRSLVFHKVFVLTKFLKLTEWYLCRCFFRNNFVNRGTSAQVFYCEF